MAFRGGRGGFRDRGDLNRRGITKNLEGPAATFMPDRAFRLIIQRSAALGTGSFSSPLGFHAVAHTLGYFRADIKNLFRPREELTWMAPTEPPSMGDTGSALSGVSEFARWVRDMS